MASSGLATRLRARVVRTNDYQVRDLGSSASEPAVRRRRLAGGRAAAGGLLVAVSAVGLFATATRAEFPEHSYVVTRRALEPGTVVTADDLTVEPVALPPKLRSRAFDDRRRLIGTTVVGPLGAGELVQAGSVAAGLPRAKGPEMTLRLDRGTVSSVLRPGERIDVVATYGGGADAVTAMVVRGASVVDVATEPGIVDDGAAVVTVAVVDEGAALALAHAMNLAKLTVVRATGAGHSGASSISGLSGVGGAGGSGPGAGGSGASGSFSGSATAGGSPPYRGPQASANLDRSGLPGGRR